MGTNYSRRGFLGLSSKALLVAGVFSGLPDEVKSKVLDFDLSLLKDEGLSLMQGLTTETTTQLTVDVPAALPTSYHLLNPDSFQRHRPSWVKRSSREYSSWAVDKIGFEGLQLGVTYLFQVFDEAGSLLDERELRTVDLSSLEPRIAVLSCMLDFNLSKTKIWEQLDRADPDYCFFLGDNVYGDLGGLKNRPELLWRRYIETRRRTPFYHRRRLVPVVSVWDDHDYGKNDVGYDYPYKEQSLETFRSFMPQEEVGQVFEQGPGVSFVFRAFGHDFFFFDNRYFRDQPEDGHLRFWGTEQFEWMRTRLLQSPRPKWFLQGTQYFGAYSTKGQAFNLPQYTDEFTRAMNVIGQLNSSALFVSGDRHFSELQEIEVERVGHRTYEITSSHMHSFTSPKQEDNDRRQELVRESNFITVDLKNSLYGSLYEVRSIAKKRQEFRRVLHIV